MNRTYPSRPFAAVGAIIFRKKRHGCGHEILLVRRGKEPACGKWSIPGGAVELGETVRDAARREVMEECGIDIRPIEVFDVFDNMVRDGEGRVLYHYVIVDFIAELGEGELRPASDATEVRWFPLDEAVNLDLTTGAGGVIHRLLDGAGK